MAVNFLHRNIYSTLSCIYTNITGVRRKSNKKECFLYSVSTINRKSVNARTIIQSNNSILFPFEFKYSAKVNKIFWNKIQVIRITYFVNRKIIPTFAPELKK